MIAKFDKWVPNDLATPRAIIVLTPPSNCDGRGEVKSRVWQEFATKHSCALVGCWFQDDVPSGIEEYCNLHCDGYGDPVSQAGNDLDQYLNQNFGVQPKIFLWGFSAGGQFAYEYACFDAMIRENDVPRCVLGFVVNKGGIYYTALAPKRARDVPGLFILGEKDAPWRNKILEGIWGLNVTCGAKWDIHVEPGLRHEVGDSVRLGQVFFAKILEGVK